MNKLNGATSKAEALVAMQSKDSRCVTLPNSMRNGIVQMKDGTAVRCYSLSLHTPHQLPPEMWERVVLPSALPPIEGHDNQCTEEILVDSITYGFIRDKRLEFVLGAKGDIKAVHMYPPDDDSDPNAYWSNLAEQFKTAKQKQLQAENDDETSGGL